ncbi:NAD(P)-dependent oxidoreductase [Fulvivirgaceae bacterium LMO-SS25]
MKKRILIIDKMHPGIEPMLIERGFEVDLVPSISKEEVFEIIPKYHGLVVRSKMTIGKELIDKAVNLEFIARAGAGIDQIEPETLVQRNITLLNAPEGNRDALGEHAVGMLLCMLNKIHIAHQQIMEGKWDREANRGYEIMGKTIGLIGFGNMGQSFAKKLQGFTSRIIAYDKYKADLKTSLAQMVDLSAIFEESDILSIHVPLTPETKSMVNYEFLSTFSKPIFLINTSRGEVLPLKDLLKAIIEGKVRGAALDVLENEKLDELSIEEAETLDALKATGKVLFTPHVGGWTFESYEKINLVLVDKIHSLYRTENE